MKCFCGGKNTAYKRLGRANDDARQCHVACSGDAAMTCGGTNAIEVFRIRKLESPDDDDNYVGCYRDSEDNTEMSYLLVEDYAHTTIDVCRTHCERAGFAYFALEFGYMCQCGNQPPPEHLRANNARCMLVSAPRVANNKTPGNLCSKTGPIGKS